MPSLLPGISPESVRARPLAAPRGPSSFLTSRTARGKPPERRTGAFSLAPPSRTREKPLGRRKPGVRDHPEPATPSRHQDATPDAGKAAFPLCADGLLRAGIHTRGVFPSLCLYGINTVRGSRFAVRGSRFAVRGSRFAVRGSRSRFAFAVRGSRFAALARTGGDGGMPCPCHAETSATPSAGLPLAEPIKKPHRSQSLGRRPSAAPPRWERRGERRLLSAKCPLSSECPLRRGIMPARIRRYGRPCTA